MRRVRPFFLLAWAALLSATPLDEQSDFIKKVQDKTKALDAARKKVDETCASKVEPALKKIVDDWQYGFDPAKFAGPRDAAKGLYEDAVKALSDVVKKDPTYDTLLSQAKAKKWDGISKVKDALNPCLTANQLAVKKAGLPIGDFDKGKIKEYWKILEQRVVDAGKSGSGGSGPTITVGDDGLVLWRCYGPANNPFGDWWVAPAPKNAKEARTSCALPPTNYLTKIRSVRFQAGTKLEKSTCVPLFGQPGGATQYFYDSSKYGDIKKCIEDFGESSLANP